MFSWRGFLFGPPYADSFESATRFGSIFINALGVVLVLVILLEEVGLTSEAVRWSAEGIWFACAIIFAAVLAYGHWCRVPPRPDGSNPNRGHSGYGDTFDNGTNLADEVSCNKVSVSVAYAQST
ncbi:unnamed protein product [Symbiodinium natans]|uniref:Uncharacterized protein n=1 Tax=Symbiodinium natans TaxID=878477 RepID=A0A812TTH8_9DINO|nr:unnamed protein product [Symbiodinium natans]